MKRPTLVLFSKGKLKTIRELERRLARVGEMQRLLAGGETRRRVSPADREHLAKRSS